MARKIKQDGERKFIPEAELSGAERDVFERALRVDDTQSDADYVQFDGKWWKVERPPEGEASGYWLREASEF